MKNKKIIILFQGMLMGVAEIIPGVSGSTLAMVMGIYERFLELLHDVSKLAESVIKLMISSGNRKKVKQYWQKVDWNFGFLLGVGMLIAIAVLSNLLSWAIDNFPHYLLAVFFGMILASVTVPWVQIKKPGIQEFALAAIIALIVFLLLGLQPAQNQTNPSYIFLALGGMVAISGMVLPGVSGSFILLVIGLYEFIIDTIKMATKLQFDWYRITGLVVFFIGLCIGFAVFVRLLRWGLKNYRKKMMAILAGLMLGSLRALWPFIQLPQTAATDAGTTTVTKQTLANLPKILPWEMNIADSILIVLLIIVSFFAVKVLIKANKK